MEAFIYLACAAMDLLTFRALSGTFLIRRSRARWPYLCGLWVLLSALSFLPLSAAVLPFIQFFLYLAASFPAARGKWWQRLLTALLSVGLPWLSTEGFLRGTASFFSIRMTELLQRRLNCLVLLLVGRLMALLIAWLLCRLRSTEGRALGQLKWSLLMLVLPLVTLVMLPVIFFAHMGRSDLSELAFFFCCVLTAVNVATLFLLQLMETSTKKRQELALLSQQLQIQTESIRALEESYRAQRQATHDFLHHLQALASLLSRGASGAALDYVQQLQGLQTTRIFSINSHHPIVDAILNQKYQAAKTHDIDIQVQVNDLSALTLEPDRLVVLLSNLLDNAAEACLRLPTGRAIRCSVLLNGSLFLSVSNTSPAVEIMSGQIPTTKAQAEAHGFGLTTICRILKQYGAEYTFDYADGWFRFAAEIPCKERSDGPCEN